MRYQRSNTAASFVPARSGPCQRCLTFVVPRPCSWLPQPVIQDLCERWGLRPEWQHMNDGCIVLSADAVSDYINKWVLQFDRPRRMADTRLRLVAVGMGLCIAALVGYCVVCGHLVAFKRPTSCSCFQRIACSGMQARQDGKRRLLLRVMTNASFFC